MLVDRSPETTLRWMEGLSMWVCEPEVREWQLLSALLRWHWDTLRTSAVRRLPTLWQSQRRARSLQHSPRLAEVMVMTVALLGQECTPHPRADWSCPQESLQLNQKAPQLQLPPYNPSTCSWQLMQHTLLAVSAAICQPRELPQSMKYTFLHPHFLVAIFPTLCRWYATRPLVVVWQLRAPGSRSTASAPMELF